MAMVFDPQRKQRKKSKEATKSSTTTQLDVLLANSFLGFGRNVVKGEKKVFFEMDMKIRRGIDGYKINWVIVYILE